jgi:hypothetical protein
MRRFMLFPIVFLLACGSAGGSRPKNIPKPDVGAELTHDVFFGSGSTAPATIEVRARNRASVPIELRRVELSSPGMLEWGIVPTSREFRDVIAPGETKSVTLFATAETTVRRPTEPLSIRAIVEFEAGGARWREVIITR